LPQAIGKVRIVGLRRRMLDAATETERKIRQQWRKHTNSHFRA